MGDWLTVRIIGECGIEDVSALRDITYIPDVMDTDKEWLPLCGGNGLCSLGDWASTKIDVGGNCFERDFDAEDIADHLRRIAEVAPSARLVVHCGGPYESTDCTATVTLNETGVSIGPPAVATVVGVGMDQAMGRLFGQLANRGL